MGPPPANSPTMYSTLVYQDRNFGLGKPAYSQKKNIYERNQSGCEKDKNVGFLPFVL